MLVPTPHLSVRNLLGKFSQRHEYFHQWARTRGLRYSGTHPVGWAAPTHRQGPTVCRTPKDKGAWQCHPLCSNDLTVFLAAGRGRLFWQHCENHWSQAYGSFSIHQNKTKNSMETSGWVAKEVTNSFPPSMFRAVLWTFEPGLCFAPVHMNERASACCTAAVCPWALVLTL